MNFNIDGATILKVKHGSHAYGLNTPESDLDVKGVCIEPLQYHLGFQFCFEQHIEESSKGYAEDLVIYSLKKFCKLAAEANPNFIEVLFGSDEDIMFINSFGEELRSFRDNFLSKKAAHSFSGFAFSQLKRIRTHRGWLLNPPKEPPTRAQFGLPENMAVTKSELGAFESLIDKEGFAELSKEALTLFTREKAFKNLQTQWSQYQNWKATRNPKRAALEAKFGYDCKHAVNLHRLLSMCVELLETGKVNVKRTHDREELMAIRQGAWSYDRVVEEAEKLEKRCQELYKTSTVLPKSPDINKIDAFVVDLTERFLYR